MAAFVGVVFLYLASPVRREPRSSAAAVLQQRILGLALAPAASGVAVAVGTSAGHAADEREVCGIGWFKVDEQGVPLVAVAQIVRQVDLPAGRRQTVEALRSDNNERAQAAAVLLEASGSGESSGIDLSGRLADIASRSPDPVLYGFALRTCAHARPEGSSCGLLSAEQWARLDPGNAAPWFEVLGRAAAASDATGRNEALHRIATSNRNVGYYGAMAQVIIDHAPADDRGALVAWLLAIDAIGIEAAWVRYYPAITSSCRNAALADANRRQTCEAVAELMVERSQDNLDRGVGITLGERLGWPNDRTDRLQGEMQAYPAIQAAGPDAGLDCAAVRHHLDFVRSQAASGEVERQKRWIAASGRPPEEFVAIGRKLREARAERAAIADRKRVAAASAPPPSEPGR